MNNDYSERYCLLALNGCVREGNTEFLLRRLLLRREVRVDGVCEIYAGSGDFSLPRDRVLPCNHCGGCKERGACVLDDDMHAVYEAAETADFVVLASPIIFGGLTGDLMNVLSRFQCYFKDGYKKLPRIGKPKKGAVILTAGGSGRVQFAEQTAQIFMMLLNVQNPIFITSYQTDTVPSYQDTSALQKIDNLRHEWGLL